MSCLLCPDRITAPHDEEKACEKHFVVNTRRLESGQCKVRLPMTSELQPLSESCEHPKSRLLKYEQRLLIQPQIRNRYIAFVNVYEKLGHMMPVDVDKEEARNKKEECTPFYMLYFGLVKETSSATKLRVVFNASERTSNGVSFNDVLMVGATVQDDVHSILQRFRVHKISFSADRQNVPTSLGPLR